MTWHGSTPGHSNLYFEEHIISVSYTCPVVLRRWSKTSCVELIEQGAILTHSSIKDYDLDQVSAEFEQVTDRNKALCTTSTKIITPM